MTTWLNNFPNDDLNLAQMAITKSQKLNYCTAQEKEDRFHDQSLLDPSYKDQYAHITATVDAMKKVAKEHGLVNNYKSKLNLILRDHIDIFRTSFASGPEAKLPP